MAKVQRDWHVIVTDPPADPARLRAEAAWLADDNRELRAEIARLHEVLDDWRREFVEPALDQLLAHASSAPGRRASGTVSKRREQQRRADPDWQLAERARQAVAEAKKKAK